MHRDFGAEVAAFVLFSYICALNANILYLMKKSFKIIGISVASLLVLLLLSFLFIRFFFREEVVSYLQKEQKEFYVGLLQESRYAADTLRLRPVYCMDDDRLTKVESHFRLDTLFEGTEDTYQKALKIRRFVSDRLPHGNLPRMPERKNAIDLWAFADTSSYHLNCRLHSILMRDMLMSAGIKARYITCLPEDVEDQDCHVVNEVFVPELGKWAMIDSDQDQVVTDMEGVPLSLRELRDKLIAGEPYLINGEKNEGQYYDQYMAKNSYWYSRHEMSCIDDETGDLLPGDRRIALIPVGYRVQSGNTQWLFENSICTTDPEKFWE